MHGHFDMGYPESTFLQVRFWEGGHKKEYAVYARENDNNSGRPLLKAKEKNVHYFDSDSWKISTFFECLFTSYDNNYYTVARALSC